ncbi:MAG: 2TM domain-containing protein [Flavobacteriaceae bacterium]|nr:2TM domain-containing protein [Flavobacteriaceae bacterium]
MSKQKSKQKQFEDAKKRVNKLKIFYIHLAGYIVVLSLVVWNLLIIEDGEYKKAIVLLNWTTIVVWGIFIIIHAWTTFKGRFLFSKKWEDKKVKEYMEEDNTKLWE